MKSKLPSKVPLITPSKIPILIISGLIDFISTFFPYFDFIIPGGGVLLSLMWDLVGFFTIGLWALSVTSGGEKKKTWLKILAVILAEITPWLGDICPSWTSLVLSTQVGSVEEPEENE